MFAGSVATSQGLAERLIEAGYVGMLVRSFARGADPDTLNLVLLPSRVVLIDDERRRSRYPLL